MKYEIFSNNELNFLFDKMIRSAEKLTKEAKKMDVRNKSIEEIARLITNLKRNGYSIEYIERILVF